MPFYGLLSFLLSSTISNRYKKEKCQCPSTGFFHFYEMERKTQLDEYYMCQCPSTGFFHFYKKKLFQKKMMMKGVNALLRASFISTQHFLLSIEKDDECVNALLRASFISTIALRFALGEEYVRVNALLRASFISTHMKDGTYTVKEVKGGCQCPSTGFFHFYMSMVLIQTHHRQKVSMPFNGLLSFLRYQDVNIIMM